MQFEAERNIDLQYPIHIPATGERKWIKGAGKVFQDKEGTSLSIIGVNIDITKETVANKLMQRLNGELVTTNKELSAINEELVVINEELQQT